MCQLFLGEGDMNSPIELQYVVLTLIFILCATTWVNATLFSDVLLKFQSAHSSDMFMLCLLWNRVSLPAVRFHPDCSRCQSFLKVHCGQNWIYFSLISIELQLSQQVSRRKYSVEILYEFRSLACSVLSVSRE